MLERGADTVRAFDGGDLFAGVDLEALGCTTVCYRRGEDVSDRPNGVPCVGVVISGEIDVFSSEGRAVSTLGAGQAFGICNIFAQRPMPTALRCKKAATAAFLTKEQFSSLLREDPVLLERYLVLCNEKMQFLASKVELMSLSSCRERLDLWISRNRRPDGSVSLPGSKEQLARLLGVSRTSLFRELAAMSQQGLIRQRGEVIQLLNLEH